MIKLIVALTCLALAIAFSSHHARADDKDGWHDIPCGDSTLKQPESYDGPIQCRRGPIGGAEGGNGPRSPCFARQYTMLYGRAVKDAEPTQPSVYLGVYVIENGTSRCMFNMASGKDAERTIQKFSEAWAGGGGWLPLRKIENGYAVQFSSRDRQRCIGFMKRWHSTVGIVYGDYCDPKGKSLPDAYTDDEIKIRVGAAQLQE